MWKNFVSRGHKNLCHVSRGLPFQCSCRKRIFDAALKGPSHGATESKPVGVLVLMLGLTLGLAERTKKAPTRERRGLVLRVDEHCELGVVEPVSFTDCAPELLTLFVAAQLLFLDAVAEVDGVCSLAYLTNEVQS